MSLFFIFFENELILQSKAEDTKGKHAKQEREAYQIEQLDLKKGGVTPFHKWAEPFLRANCASSCAAELKVRLRCLKEQKSKDD